MDLRPDGQLALWPGGETVTGPDSPRKLDPDKAYAVVVRHHTEVANLALTLAFSPAELELHLKMHRDRGWGTTVFYRQHPEGN